MQPLKYNKLQSNICVYPSRGSFQAWHHRQHTSHFTVKLFSIKYGCSLARPCISIYITNSTEETCDIRTIYRNHREWPIHELIDQSARFFSEYRNLCRSFTKYTININQIMTERDTADVTIPWLNRENHREEFYTSLLHLIRMTKFRKTDAVKTRAMARDTASDRGAKKINRNETRFPTQMILCFSSPKWSPGVAI